MAAPKGHKRWGGRKKGTPNKVTASIREMILGALDASGGQKYLEKQAKENPTAFLTLLGKTVPTEVKGNFKGSATLTVLLSGGK